MKSLNFKNSSVIIFIIISLFYAIGNIVWWYLNTPIIPHGYSALHFLDIFQDLLLYQNAPLLTWIMKGIFFIFGKKYFDLQIIIVNYVFFLIALYFIYKIGLELKNKETGNIAMILFALTPAVYGMSRQYGHQDWHVMIAMTANIYCLIKLNDFKDRKWSILYGITVGLGLLVKDAFLAYFFVPWLYVAIRSLREKTETKKIINILITIIIGSLIAGCHYFRYNIIYKILNEPTRETVNIFTYENIKMMTLGLSDELLSLILFIIFLICFIWFIIKFNNKNKWSILLWIIIPWLIIMFMPHHKEPEYSIGFVPAIILIIALFFSDIKTKIIKIGFFPILVIILLLQFFDLSYKKISLFDNAHYYNRYNLMFYDRSRIKSFMELIENLKSFKNNKLFIYNTDNYFIQLHTLSAIILLNDLKICSDIFEADIVFCNGREKTLDELANMDFLLTNIAYFADTTTKDNFIKIKKEEHKKIRNMFVENFYLYKAWYLQNIEDEEHFVRLYKKKNIQNR